MTKNGEVMNIQEACEVLEELLERDLENNFLKAKEFNALNRILLKAAVEFNYKVPDRLMKN